MAVARVGVAQVDITPDWAGPISGWGIGFAAARATPPSDPTERTFATAVALSGGDGDVTVLANIDIHGGSRPVRDGAARLAGIDPGRLVLCGSHTHNGPGQPYGGFLFSLGSSSPFGLRRMRHHLVDRVGRAVKEAIANLAPGGVDVVRGPVDDVGNNRAVPAWKHYPDEVVDAFMTSGPGRTLSDRARDAERFHDPRLTVLVASSDDGRQLGLLGWYGVHPNSLGQTWPTYSADLYGWARAEVRSRRPDALVGFGAGAVGDVSPLTLADNGHLEPPHTSAAEVQGRDLASTIGRRLGSAMVDLVAGARPKPFSLASVHRDWTPTDSLPSPSYGMTQLGGGIDGPSKQWATLEAGAESGRAKALAHRQYPMAGGQGPKLPWPYSLVRVPIPVGWLFRLSIPKTLPLHALRLGDHVFVTVPGEPTTMAAWRFELAALEASSATTASVLGCTGDYCGYWVTPEEYLEQRYEAASTVYGRSAASALSEQLASLAADAAIP